ncbi:MAG: hypothetical protein ABJB47_19740, partial [Actinomycetota bacterium]
MRLDSAHLDHARKVADAILFEGYLLYPYHRSAQKNQIRFQFGVLMPPAYRELDDCEPSASQTECLVECADDAEILVVVRFLQMQRRTVQAISPDTGALHEVGTLYLDGTEYTAWDEATEREQHVTVNVASLLSGDRNTEFHAGAGESAEELTDSRGREAGRVIRQWAAIDGMIRLHAERVAGPYQALRLRIRVENHSTPTAALRVREDGLRHAMIAAHELIGVPGGKFLSMTDPPEWAAKEVGSCVNTGTWPVLAGPDDCADLLLSSPVILYDHPEVAAESAGDLFDATEIDEILTLRTMALTDAEKREARSSDPRAAQLIDRLDHIPPEMLERMHGAIRYLRPVAGTPPTQPAAGMQHPLPDGMTPGLPGWPPDDIPTWSTPGMVTLPDGGLTADSLLGDGPAGQVTGRPSAPWWDPGADASVSPATDHVMVAGVRVASGSRIIMRPGVRRADAQDLFLIGREATVQAVLHDVDGQIHVAVSPDNDPAAELQRNHGRFLYFSPDEIEPIEPAGLGG